MGRHEGPGSCVPDRLYLPHHYPGCRLPHRIKRSHRGGPGATPPGVPRGDGGDVSPCAPKPRSCSGPEQAAEWYPPPNHGTPTVKVWCGRARYRELSFSLSRRARLLTLPFSPPLASLPVKGGVWPPSFRLHWPQSGGSRNPPGSSGNPRMVGKDTV